MLWNVTLVLLHFTTRPFSGLHAPSSDFITLPVHEHSKYRVHLKHCCESFYDSIYLTHVRKGLVFLCVCVCVSFLCVVVFIWKYLCLPVAHNMCLCFTIHLGSSRASCVCMMGDGVQPAWCLPSALYLPPSVLLPSILTSLLVGFPNWHVYGCQEQVGWGTWLLPPCLPSFRCFCPQCLPPRPGKV